MAYSHDAHGSMKCTSLCLDLVALMVLQATFAQNTEEGLCPRVAAQIVDSARVKQNAETSVGKAGAKVTCTLLPCVG